MLHEDYQALQDVRALRQNPKVAKDAVALAGSGGGRGFAAAEGGDTLSRLNGELTALFEIVEGADATPTTQAVAAVTELQHRLDALLAKARDLKSRAQ